METPSKPSQKDIERRQFDRFAQLSGVVPPGVITPFEEPDFLVDQAPQRLGIELTDLFWEQRPGITPQQAIESLRARTAELVGRIYSEQKLPAVHASIHFSPHFVPTKKDVPRLANAIARIVAANVPAEGGHYEEDYDWENRAYFPEEVHHISVWRFASLDRPFFTSPSASFIPVLGTADIERALALKEVKVDRYRQSAEEVWLVVNCDGGKLSTAFEFDEEVLGHTFASKFDRAFLVRHVAGKAHELQLRRTET